MSKKKPMIAYCSGCGQFTVWIDETELKDVIALTCPRCAASVRIVGEESTLEVRGQNTNEVEQVTTGLIKTMRTRDYSPEIRSPAQHLPVHADEKAIFISYAWSGESENIANQVDHAFSEKGVTIIRDKREIGFKDRIKDFMERIGRGKCVIVIISEKYLKSENCMFELLQIARHRQFVDRIFPIVLDDAKIYKPIDRIKYVQHWEEEVQKLDQELKSVSAANLQGFREDIDLYTKIRESISNLTNVLKDMNTLTVQMHKESAFEALFKAVEQKLSE